MAPRAVRRGRERSPHPRTNPGLSHGLPGSQPSSCRCRSSHGHQRAPPAHQPGARGRTASPTPGGRRPRAWLGCGPSRKGSSLCSPRCLRLQVGECGSCPAHPTGCRPGDPLGVGRGGGAQARGGAVCLATLSWYPKLQDCTGPDGQTWLGSRSSLHCAGGTPLALRASLGAGRGGGPSAPETVSSGLEAGHPQSVHPRRGSRPPQPQGPRGGGQRHHFQRQCGWGQLAVGPSNLRMQGWWPCPPWWLHRPVAAGL